MKNNGANNIKVDRKEQRQVDERGTVTGLLSQRKEQGETRSEMRDWAREDSIIQPGRGENIHTHTPRQPYYTHPPPRPPTDPPTSTTTYPPTHIHDHLPTHPHPRPPTHIQDHPLIHTPTHFHDHEHSLAHSPTPPTS
ncbi:hypothetical protein Pmani_021301 [Petrolisthes manimaculis]|uniref:Uncharacterized protein n=1 Tax=Petrolisthes manimaculis TaxID=1843537 RepID=A0AAE1PGY0_9EUCA|nr:hypothetical protein Pmani_021301 [Petrolisthes manimaculis]